MRKALLFASMATAALCVACNVSEIEISVPENDSNTVPEGYKTVTVSASKDDAQSKTTYAGEKTFAWSDGDQISIWCTDASVPANTGFYTFTIDTGGSASATFTGTIPGTAEIGNVALFPANASHSFADGKYHFQVAGEKDYIGVSQSADIPMYGVNGGSDNFSFTQMTGAVKFTVDNVPEGVTQVKFTFTAATSKLSGSFDVTTSSPYTWSTSSTETASEKSIVRYCPVTSNAFSVYVPYTEGTIWGDNTLLIQDYTGGSVGSTLYTQSNIGAIPITRNKVTKLSTLSCGYRSAFGVDWDAVAATNNADDTYPAIKSMKATMDAGYFYILLDVNGTSLTYDHDYDHYIFIYVGNDSDSANYWSTDNYSELKAHIGSEDKSTSGWAVKAGKPAFNLSSNREFSSNVSRIQNSVYYELRIPRNATMYAPLAQTENPVKLGVVIDDTKYDGGAYSHIYSPEKKVGIIPTRGTAMYVVPQYTAPVSVVVTGAAAIDKTYHETITETVNPERGMYRHNEYKFNGGAPSTSVSCEDDKTLVLTIFYLADYVSSEHVTGAVSTIETILGNVRATGKKAIVRFAYNWDKDTTPHEPSITNLPNHINDLAATLESYKDIIYVLQAGFIGTYGEWYYTDGDFPKPTLSGDAVTNYTNRAAIIDALLAAVPEGIQIAVRTPYYKNYYLYPSSVYTWDALSAWDGTSANARLSFHNDAFLADANDMGTFKSDAERNMWKSQSSWLAVGGETGFVDTVDETYCALTPALNTIGQYHYSYLNDAASNNKIVKYWIANDQYQTIRKALGYRLVLNSAKITGAGWTNGTSLNFKLNISNTGSASVIYPRPCKLVLIHNGTPTVLKDMGAVRDIRNITPGSNYTYDFDVTLPQDVYTGDKIAIWMPDKTAGLQGTAAYSIRLSNGDVKWDNGYNVIYTF